MDHELFEWLLLLGRWLHIVVGIAWIGNSLFFMWLDRTFEFNAESKTPGHIGDLWMVHGGGFYKVEKLQMGPTKVPAHLHWFKWESYWTWMSGIFLLGMIFYAGNGTFLLDSSVSSITFMQALGLSFASLLVSWFFYDFLWESKLTKTQPILGHILTLAWFGGMVYFLCHTLSGRAAYIHIGGMLGTWMTANVFLRIIPRQVLMVEASKRGEPVNQEWGKNAKNRSTHNTYFTLPVIFIMLSNHFPSTYGNKYNWIILLLMSAAGAAIREFFVTRIKNPPRSKVFGAIAVAIILFVIFFSRENTGSAKVATQNHHESEAITSPTATISGTGSIYGIVGFSGTIPQSEKLLLPLVCTPDKKADTYANKIIINKDGMIKNALVRIIDGLGKQVFTDIPSQPVVIDQKSCQYEPRVVGVRVEQKVEFLNSDDTFHNVRSLSKNNENFNEAMPAKNDRITKVFNKPEIFVQSKCSVHPWMSASIAVMDHPYFSVTNEAGFYEIKNIPPGNYMVEVWHEVFGTHKTRIGIKANQSDKIDFGFKR
ncbi:MAG: urate hydroxylase PuuD [Xanthomonadaceae bacterium]|nr:urate hydroxylase PuuD [Xanthomonadaceae bacterium]